MTTPTTDRASRAETIRAEALVRRAYGQAAVLRRAGDRWCVWLHGRLVVDVGTVEEAVRLAAREGKAP